MFRELINQSPVSTSIFHPDGSLFYINPAQMNMRGIQEKDLSTFIRDYNIFEETARRERARLHDQLLQSQKFEGLGVLAGGIAHDFNNLMTPILGNADLLGQKLPPGSTDHGHVEAILSASIRASDLCKQMLEYAGSGEYIPEEVDLTDEVQAMSHLLEISTPKNAELVKELNYQLPVVMLDKIQLREVILNMLINAAESLKGKAGLITLKTGEVELTESGDEYLTLIQKIPSGHYVYLELADTGCGFDEQTRQKIFDPFYTTKFQGRGLGLSSVLGVLSSHGGSISVISTPGSGSIFRAYIPVIKK